MFITLTIDTTNKKKAKKFMFATKKANPAQGWRKNVYTKKRSLVDKFNTWKKSFKNKQFYFDKQIVTFATGNCDS